ncbi:hypothetical protein F5Y04DRAFT_276810 [Hypomontagnella monticulosa]|nr:hypothetical protein F5Y04DRAFT_276810 [Hypomontagnella monticulosa]
MKRHYEMDNDGVRSRIGEPIAGSSVRVGPTTSNKGLGCFATHDISTGERVIVERHIMWSREHDDIYDTLNEHLRHFNELSNEDQQTYLELYPLLRPESVTELHQILGGSLSDGTQLTPEEIDRYARVELIYRSNAFEIGEPSLNDDGKINRRCSAVFPIASRLNHSCRPNLFYTTEMLPGFIICTAARDIKKGEELTISYLPYNTPERRRAWLRADDGFHCQCEICVGNDTVLKDEFEEDAAEANRLERLLAADGTWLTRGPDALMEDLIHLRDALTELSWHENLFFVASDLSVVYESNYIRSRKEEFIRNAVRSQEIAITSGAVVWRHNERLVANAVDRLQRLKTTLRGHIREGKPPRLA